MARSQLAADFHIAKQESASGVDIYEGVQGGQRCYDGVACVYDATHRSLLSRGIEKLDDTNDVSIHRASHFRQVSSPPIKDTVRRSSLVLFFIVRFTRSAPCFKCTQREGGARCALSGAARDVQPSRPHLFSTLAPFRSL